MHLQHFATFESNDVIKKKLTALLRVVSSLSSSFRSISSFAEAMGYFLGGIAGVSGCVGSVTPYFDNVTSSSSFPSLLSTVDTRVRISPNRVCTR